MNAIEINHVSKHFKGFSIEDLTMNLPAGCIMGLVGENGAGKSTTINLIMDAVPKDGGDIKVLGVDTKSKEFKDVKHEIGVVLDEAYFPEVLSAMDVNKVMKHTYKNWEEAKYMELIHDFDLPKSKMFRDYSKGMKMKLAIAVAMSHKPKLLVLDEATGGLDPVIRDEILDKFNDFTREEDHSILISSHIISDLEKICDYIAFLHEGRLLFCEEKDRLKETYGMLHITEEEYRELPKDAVAGSRRNGYSVEVLVKRELIAAGYEAEPVSVEEIILFLVKKEKMR